MTGALRAQAAHAVDVIAERLAEPAAVAAVAAACTVETDTGHRTVWAPVSLTDGHPAVALLFAELAAGDARFRAPAHAHLAAAVASGVSEGGGLFDGAAALAFAGHVAGRGHGGYARLLDSLDPAIATRARHCAKACRHRLAHGEPVGSWAAYDVTGGATGIGRYLLMRSGPGITESLSEVIGTVTAIATGQESGWFADNHLNLGLAHGVAGPLALLAIASGAEVPGLAEPADRIVGLLQRWCHHDEAGPFWPRRAVHGVAAARERDAWCHGAAGVGRALYLAGRSFDRREWTELGHAALRSAIPPGEEGLPYDCALCHGWAGLLQITLRMAHDTGDAYYVTAADTLAARLLDGFDPAAPFGYRFPHPRADRPLDRPGLLDGAAGVALALHTYAIASPPRTPWDTALLLA